ncbi:ATP-binding cassette domain-containing protein [Ruminococcus albus]|uniref:ABC-2 type transport system ATP-binding protein n=1 Tax=Ruminococcus albus TaxID=1264 RepID=A0A1H7FTC3_RUMAL|nr:ABC transporter ATP-binding protein [Ruminococcus albus]SEK29333.1 ABC-2 type transport system ATP-binding protein [Ruminococcus albus]
MSRIEIKTLTKKYKKKTALDGVSLSIDNGMIYGLLGRNGSGKSTLVDLVGGRIFPDLGEITIDGETVTENDKLLRKIYCMSSDDLLPMHMRVKDTIKAQAYFYKNTDEDYAIRLCDVFGIDPKKRLSQLSTGQRTLAKVSLALSSGADFIFLDEPTLGVDANFREELYKKIIERFDKTEAAFIISTHLIDECAGLFEHCFVLEEGRLIADEDCEELQANAYLIEGRAKDVTEYLKDKQCLKKTIIGTLCSACVKGEVKDVPDGLEVSHPSLQQLLIAMTGGVQDG